MSKKEAAAAAAKKSIVEAIVKVEGDLKGHALSELFESNSAPVIKSVGHTRLPGTNMHVSYTIHSKGTQVLKVEVGEPNVRPIAEEEAKLNFVDCFLNDEFEELQ